MFIGDLFVKSDKTIELSIIFLLFVTRLRLPSAPLSSLRMSWAVSMALLRRCRGLCMWFSSRAAASTADGLAPGARLFIRSIRAVRSGAKPTTAMVSASPAGNGNPDDNESKASFKLVGKLAVEADCGGLEPARLR